MIKFTIIILLMFLPILANATNGYFTHDDQALFNILAPGVVEDHVTIGATIKTNGRGEISFEAMHALPNSVKGSNPFDPTQEIRIEMDQFKIGLGWPKEF